MRWAEFELPTLQGSSKRVAWAKELREEYLDQLREQAQPDIDRARTEGHSDEDIDSRLRDVAHHLQRWLDERDHARWWIDHRACLKREAGYDLTRAMHAHWALPEIWGGLRSKVARGRAISPDTIEAIRLRGGEEEKLKALDYIRTHTKEKK